MLQVENNRKNIRHVPKTAIWKIVPKSDVSTSSEEPNKYEVVSSTSGFDPTECSPPNSFMDNLKQRMSIYYK